MRTSDHAAAHWLATDLAANGLRLAVVSPGSRNAPLVLAFHHHPDIELVVAVDERAAAHIALGMGLRNRIPAAILTTSGTAAVNVGPAVAEAFHQGTPLIAITADRPVASIGKGHGQTVFQSGLFSSHVQFEACLDELALSEVEMRECVARGWEAARTGPVHFNVPFEEPLYGTTTPTGAKSPKQSGAVTSDSSVALALAPEAFALLLLGPQSHTHRRTVPAAWSDRFEIIADAFSGWKGVESCAERWLETRGDWTPEVVITVGVPPMSKRLRQFLTGSEARHIHLGRQAWDVFGRLEHIDTATPEIWLDTWSGSATASTTASTACRTTPPSHFPATLLTDLSVFQAVADQAPADCTVHIANSTAARYAQLVDWKVNRLHANRGVAGIDGCTSTAVGEALSHPATPTVLITGDLAFLYDLNGLWVDPAPLNLSIVVIDNGGGAIFRWLDGPHRTGLLSRYFEGGLCRTSESGGSRSLEHAVLSTGASYRAVHRLEELSEGVEWLFQESGETDRGVQVLVVKTERAASDLEYQKRLLPVKNPQTETK